MEHYSKYTSMAGARVSSTFGEEINSASSSHGVSQAASSVRAKSAIPLSGIVTHKCPLSRNFPGDPLPFYLNRGNPIENAANVLTAAREVTAQLTRRIKSFGTSIPCHVTSRPNLWLRSEREIPKSSYEIQIEDQWTLCDVFR